MKIGDVVRAYGVTVHTLYYYIQTGLLVPPRKNKQYDFDERTRDDLTWILELKDLGFSLEAIHRLLSLRRISGFCAPEDREELLQFFRVREQELREEENRIRAIRQRVRRSLEELSAPPVDRLRTGVPLSMLSLLRCPRCGGEFLLENASMSQTSLFSAGLRCACGCTAVIRDGILETGQINQSAYDWPDPHREIYRELPSATLTLFEQTCRQLENGNSTLPPGNRVWLEGHVNAWFFFHSRLDLLQPGDQLIVADKFPETLRAYKAILEARKPACEILYIADSSDRLPLRSGCIDCVMDFFSSNERSFYQPGFYLDTILPLLKADSQIFGAFFHFPDGPRSLRRLKTQYPEAVPEGFSLARFEKSLARNFRILSFEGCGISLESGDNVGFGFHVPGEELHFQAYRACRRHPASEP